MGHDQSDGPGRNQPGGITTPGKDAESAVQETRDAELQEHIKRYARGDLSAEERRAFEDRMFEDDRLMEEVRFFIAVRDEVHAHEVSSTPGVLDEASTEPVTVIDHLRRPTGSERGAASSGASWLAAARGIVRRPPIGLAASLLIGALVGVQLSNNFADRTQAPITTPAVFSLDTLRSTPDSADLPRIRSVGGDEWVTLLLYPDFGDYAAFRVRIERSRRDGTSDLVWEGTSIAAGDTERLAVVIQRSELTTGLHRVSIEGQPAASAAAPADYVKAGETAFVVE